MLNKIRSYVILKFSKIFLAVFISLILLTIIIDFIELTRRLAGKSVNLLQIIELTFLKQPLLISDLMPFVILIATILFLVKLNDNSEITILKSSGTSLKYIFKGPIAMIILLSVLEVTLLNHVAVFAENSYKNKISDILSPNHTSKSLSSSKDIKQELWFKQNQQDIPYIFKSQKITFQEDSLELYDIMLFFLDDANNQDNILYAKRAIIKEKQLELYDISKVGDKVKKDILILPTSLTEDFIQSKIFTDSNATDAVSLWHLISSIKLLKQTGFNINKQLALLNFYIIKPIFYVYLFLLAAIFCIYPPRHQKKILYIISSVVIGFASYFILNVFYSLAVLSKLSIISGIWIPNLFLLLLVIYLLIKKERGYFI